MADPLIEVHESPADWARAAADRIVETLRSAIETRGRARLVLAGGTTPRSAYQELARRPGALDWKAVDFLWSDERIVDPHDPRSNVHMARQALLTPLDIDDTQVFAPRVDLGARDAALAYEITLRSLCPETPPQPDCTLLGLGTDGHTASLFPGGPELEAQDYCVVSYAPDEPRERITLTLPVLSASRQVFFLVTGRRKAAALRRVLAGDDLPAARVRPAPGTLSWIVDREAMGSEA